MDAAEDWQSQAVSRPDIGQQGDNSGYR